MKSDPTQPFGEIAPEGGSQAPGVNLLILGVVLAILGLVIITAATFQFDLVKDHVLKAHPSFAPYLAAIGYVCAISGLLLALVHFIREG